MEIVDINGVKHEEMDLDHFMEPQSVEIDLTTYSSGVYFLIFTDESGTFRQQIKVSKE